MPNYNEQSVIIDYAGTNFTLPPYDFYDPFSNREQAMREFIFILRYYKNKLNPPITYISAPFPYPTLYDDVFHHFVHTDPADNENFVENQNETPLVYKDLPDPSSTETDYNKVLPNLIFPFKLDPCLINPPDPASIAEGMILFSHYYLTRELAFSTIYSKSVFEDEIIHTKIPELSNMNINRLFRVGTTSELENLADASINTKSIIYQALYSELKLDMLTGEGFLPLETITRDQRIAFNNILDVKAAIGKYNTPISLTTTTNPEDFFYTSPITDPENPTNQLTYTSISERLYLQVYRSNFPGITSSKMYQFSSPLTGAVLGTKRRLILEKIREIITDKIAKVAKDVFDYEVNGIWSLIYPRKAPPVFQIAATGDGSSTYGLFYNWNLGALFFQYNYDLTNALTDVKHTKLVSLPWQPKSSILLKTYGAQPSANYYPTELEVIYTDPDLGYKVHISFEISLATITILLKPIFAKLSLVTDPLIPNISRVQFDTGSGKKDIAIWDKSKASLRLLSDKVFNIDVQQQSGNSRTSGSVEKDEVQSIISVVPDPYFSPLYISASDLYRNDKFFLTINRISKLFSTPQQDAALEDIIDLIVNQNADIEVVGLYGNFVGKKDPAGARYGFSDIIADIDYLPNVNTALPETSIDPDSYDPLRYSFASINLDRTVCSNPKIQIRIDSFVSPRHSTLKDRMDLSDPYDYDYRNGTIPVITPPLPGGPSPDGTLLKNSYTNGYVIAGIGKNSYNQPLAILRSMGLLEGIAFRILKKAETLFKNDLASYGIVKNALSTMLNAAVSVDNTAEIRGFTPTSNPPEYSSAPLLYNDIKLSNSIDFTTFLNFKWYALKSIVRKDGPGTASDAILPIEDLIIDGKQQYEYFDYYHETW